MVDSVNKFITRVGELCKVVVDQLGDVGCRDAREENLEMVFKTTADLAVKSHSFVQTLQCDEV